MGLNPFRVYFVIAICKECDSTLVSVTFTGEGRRRPDHLVHIRQRQGVSGGRQHPHHPGQASHLRQGAQVHTGQTLPDSVFNVLFSPFFFEIDRNV